MREMERDRERGRERKRERERAGAVLQPLKSLLPTKGRSQLSTRAFSHDRILSFRISGSFKAGSIYMTLY